MSRHVLVSMVVVLCFLAVAQSSGSGATVQTSSTKPYGTYLVDAKHEALYVLSSDSKDKSTCTGACAKAWPPLTVSGHPTAGSGVASGLLGTLARQDGSTQVTYGGKPLYTFSKDSSPGDTTGEGVKAFGGEWTLIDSYGDPLAPPTSGKGKTGQSPSISKSELAALEKQGQGIFYAKCAVCHGVKGGGGVGPQLAGYGPLSVTSAVIAQILDGGHQMPAFRKKLSDVQIAAVATYIRTAWGNNDGGVTKEEVSKAR